MKKSTLILPALFLLILTLKSAAQDPIAALNKLATQYPAEKIYIHYDRDYYAAGETIWFKAYLFYNGMPSTLSNNFYLQLVGNKGEVIAERKYPVKGATVTGSLVLPDSMFRGYYHVRALTPAMLNNNPDFLYRKNIFVFGQTRDNPPAQPVPGSVVLQFFPESGHMVGDILSAVAFRATDAEGNPVDISGLVKMEDGTMITAFSTSRPGFGKIQFKPQTGKKYIASTEWNGTTTYHRLPEVENSGINLKIENEKGGKMFVLSRSKKNKELYDKLFLVGHMNNLVVFEQEIVFDSYYSVKGHLLTDSLPSGIIHFTVFDKAGAPLAERLSFVNNHEFESSGTVNVIKKGTGPREENIIEISFPDAVQRSLSVAVTDEKVTSPVPGESMANRLLVRDDIGYVQGAEESVAKDADSLKIDAFDKSLLTKHWKRFTWNDILAGKYPEKRVGDPYLLSFTGNLKDGKTKAPVQQGDLFLFVESEDTVKQEFQVPVSSSGHFRIDSLLLYGESEFYFAYKTPEGKSRVADMTVIPVSNDNFLATLPFAISKEEKLEMYRDSLLLVKGFVEAKTPQSSKLSEQRELDPVIVESKRTRRPIEQVNEKYTKGAFTAMGKINLDLVTFPENNKALSVYDYVRRSIRQMGEEDGKFVNTKVHSLFNASSNEWDAKGQKTLDSMLSASAGGAPGSARFVDMGIREKGGYYSIAVYLNESPIDINFLKTIRIDNVALIKFFEPGFLGAGMAGPGGTLCVYTKNEVVVPKAMDDLDHVTVNGFSPMGRFPNPEYSSPRTPDEPADTRPTLYWNPDMLLDEKTKTVQVKFYNNDTGRRIRVVVEGFDAKGKLISIVKVIGDND